MCHVKKISEGGSPGPPELKGESEIREREREREEGGEGGREGGTEGMRWKVPSPRQNLGNATTSNKVKIQS